VDKPEPESGGGRFWLRVFGAAAHARLGFDVSHPFADRGVYGFFRDGRTGGLGRTGVILSGGNVDADVLSAILSEI